MLEVRHLTKKYGSFTAVRDLSLSVPAGELFGLLGPNGAGKSTVMKIVAGLLRPTAGTVRVGGYDVVQQPTEAKALIGYLPEVPFLYERLTGQEFLRFIADLFDVPADQATQHARELIALFELQDAINDRIQGYSRGMRQKLALIGVLLHRPRLLILDEPLTGLDPRSARVFKDLLRQLCQEGTAVLLSTHILEIAERLCDRVGIIDRGRLVACGTMAELQAQSRQPDSSLEDLFLSLTGGAAVAELVDSLTD